MFICLETKLRNVRARYLAVALPIDEKSILVDFEQAVRLVVGRLLVLEPSIEYRALSQELRHFYPPIKLELLCHGAGFERNARYRDSNRAT